MSILQALVVKRTVTGGGIPSEPTPISLVFDSGNEIVYFNDETQTDTAISLVFDSGEEIVYFNDETQTTTAISLAFSGTT